MGIVKLLLVVVGLFICFLQLIGGTALVTAGIGLLIGVTAFIGLFVLLVPAIETYPVLGFLLMLGLFIYFIPTLAAPQGTRSTIFLINLLIGWTIIGWIWTCRLSAGATEHERRKQQERSDCLSDILYKLDRLEKIDSFKRLDDQ